MYVLFKSCLTKKGHDKQPHLRLLSYLHILNQRPIFLTFKINQQDYPLLLKFQHNLLGKHSASCIHLLMKFRDQKLEQITSFEQKQR
ncbi:hypothetical protein EUGRSUZ_H05006 [Eucalyptus grandis]|uniref:Uncharacterized protein n=2 Tax=Eucalyptus grandis TaxID=71139 RepID=A0ACC3K4T0_EUCGR|nr:hypothetical protein EUGRSUZ_H05006 [Eucalyptus grandis]